MKRVEMHDEAAPLEELVRQARTEPIVITVGGKAVAALTAIGTNTDLESLLVGNDPRFRALIERSRARNPPGTGLSMDEVRRRLRQGRGGPSRGATRRRRSAVARKRRAKSR